MKRKMFILLWIMVFEISLASALELTSEEKENILLSQGSQEIIDLYNEQPFEMGPEWFDEDGNLVKLNILKQLQILILIHRII